MATPTLTAVSFKALDEFLGERDSRKVGNNHYVIRRNVGTIAARLHDTDILTFRDDDTVQLQTGGWTTVYTKEKMNEWLCPSIARVASDRGKWYVGTSYGSQRYYDGMLIDTENGRVISEPPDFAAIDSHNRALERKIASLIEGLTPDAVTFAYRRRYDILNIPACLDSGMLTYALLIAAYTRHEGTNAGQYLGWDVDTAARRGEVHDRMKEALRSLFRTQREGWYTKRGWVESGHAGERNGFKVY